MTLTFNFRLGALIILLGGLVFLFSSCKKENKGAGIQLGTVSGTVTSENGESISDVVVTLSDVEGAVNTADDGKYSFSDVPIGKHAVVFTKKGFMTVSKTVLSGDFDSDRMATVNISMVAADGKITGVVTDGKNNGAPLAGVKVTLGVMSVQTGDDGTYLFESLLLDNYTLTFEKAGYPTLTKEVAKSDFVDDLFEVNVEMGRVELFRGLTADDLQKADKWYYNEYRGGGNADAYPHWDWACDYMSSLTLWGNWEEQWEGTTLRIRNDGDEQKNPADLDMFDSYIYGSKKITADNKILSLRVRTHNADAAAPAYFGVQVVDLGAADPAAVKVGQTQTHGSGDYADYFFDLTNYIGKEIVIAIGIYRKETGDYWKQLAIRRIAFAQENVTGWNWIPGTEVIPGWKLTQEMVRSTMANRHTSFTGISPKSAGRDVNMQSGYPAAYHAWRDVSHIGYEWAFMPVNKDPEVFASEGYLIKTRGNGAVNTNVPESYFYVKLPIAAGRNQLTFKTRNFGSEYTYFKITAIDDNGTIVHLDPVSNTAQEASAAPDGCWKFKHNAGNRDNPNDYASFVYDLSQFNARDVVVVFGVYNGEMNSAENKLVFYNVTLN